MVECFTSIQSVGYTLNKQEFRDSVCLRYGWNVPNTPSFCQCGKENDVDHALSCKKGGYVAMRHNRVRDLEAELMKEDRDAVTQPKKQDWMWQVWVLGVRMRKHF